MTANSTKKNVGADTLTLSPSEILASLRALSHTNISAFIWGPPGIAKSAVAKQMASGEGIAFIDVRLSQMDPTDLRGIPVPNQDDGEVFWSPPKTLPKDLDVVKVVALEAIDTEVRFTNPKADNGIHYVTDIALTVRALNPAHTVEIIDQPGMTEDSPLDRFTVVLKDANGNPVEGKIQYRVKGAAKGILALEEFNSAPPSVQAASYQLVLDRRLGEYIVPDGVRIIAMGNRDTDKGITFKMADPVKNRFVHYEMRATFEDWERWAHSEGVNSQVIGYLTAFKHELFQHEPGSASRGFATPRSWTFVSDFLNANDGELPEMVALATFVGAIGDASGLKFNEFRKISAQLPPPEEILSGRLTKMPTINGQKVEVSLAYALTTTLCYELKEREERIRRVHGKDWDNNNDRKQWLKEADNFLLFIMQNFPPEIGIMGTRTAIQIHALPFCTTRMKHIDTFAGKFRDLIMS
jgi:MoxR-like ATPase